MSNEQARGSKFLQFISVTLVALLFVGCATSSSAPLTTRSAPPVAVSPPEPPAEPTGLKVSRLDQLWESRRSGTGEFPIGPGDVITVMVPGLPDMAGGAAPVATDSTMQQQTAEQGLGGATGLGGGTGLGGATAKVSGQGYIVLPLVGRVHAGGLTEEQLQQELTQRFGKFMYDPDVEITVQSYNSRQVSVSGEVHNPGMYTIVRPNETVRDMIVLAGGTTDNAGSRVVLTPAPVKLSNLLASNTSAGGSMNASGDPSYASVSDTNPLSAPGVSGTTLSATYVIDLSRGQSNQRYLNIPVRPGDTIYVPSSGSVTIIGWVYTPKTIQITPGLTVLNAVSQAGGTLFAADSDRVKVLREGPKHETKTILVNLNDIRAAKTPDVLVQANDVIDVSYSAARIPGYALYYAAQGFVSFAPAALLVNGL